MSYAKGSKAEGGGHTANDRGQLVGNKLINFEVLYIGEGNFIEGNILTQGYNLIKIAVFFLYWRSW